MRDLLGAIDPTRFSHLSVQLVAGQLELEAAHGDLEEALHQVGNTLAREHGAEVSAVALDLSTPTPQSVHFIAHITAHKAIVSAKIKVTGLVLIDARLEATLSELTAKGSGLLGKLACAFIEPELEKYRGKKFALDEFVTLPVQLSDPCVTTGPRVRLIITVAANCQNPASQRLSKEVSE